MPVTRLLPVLGTLVCASALAAQVSSPGPQPPQTRGLRQTPGMPPKQPVVPPKIAPPPALPRDPQYPLVTALLPYLDDATFQAELKLTDAQKRELLAYRAKLWGNAVETTRADWRDAALKQGEETTAVFAKTLSEDQRTRALQLAARIAWMERNFTRSPATTPNLTRLSLMTLVKYPELATALELTPEQRKLIEATQFFTTSSLYLTPEQSERAAALFGTPPAKAMTAASNPRATDRGNRLESRLIALTGSSDVRADLKLTESQCDEMARLRDEWSANRTKALRESPQVQKQKFDELAAEAVKRLKVVLSADQYTRLLQLDRRSILPRENVYLFPDVAQVLGLTDAQKMAIQKATDVCSQQVEKIVLAGGDTESAEKWIRAAVDMKRKAIARILTPAQQTTAKEWLGAPFRGSTFEDRVQSTMNPQPVEFGLYTNELAYLTRNPVVRDELKLAPEQLRTLATAATNLDSHFTTQVLYSAAKHGPDRHAYEERSQAIEKAMTETLTPAQLARFHQLMVQARERVLRLRLDIQPVASAAAYPGVADALKLTDHEKDQLVNGIDPDAVLSVEQKAVLALLKGELVQGDLSPPTTRTTLTVARDGRHSHLLDRNWDALKLTRTEIDKLVPVITRFQLATVPANVIAELGGEKNQLTAAIAAFDRAVEGILTPEQLKRLEQYKFQEAAAVSYRSALARPEAKDLALTPAQVGRIAAAEIEDRQWVRLALRAEDHLNGLRGPDAVCLKLRDKLDQQVLDVLTDAQKKRWHELMGEPWPEIRKQASFHMGKLPPGSEF